MTHAKKLSSKIGPKNLYEVYQHVRKIELFNFCISAGEGRRTKKGEGEGVQGANVG